MTASDVATGLASIRLGPTQSHSRQSTLLGPDVDGIDANCLNTETSRQPDVRQLLVPSTFSPLRTSRGGSVSAAASQLAVPADRPSSASPRHLAVPADRLSNASPRHSGAEHPVAVTRGTVARANVSRQHDSGGAGGSYVKPRGSRWGALNMRRTGTLGNTNANTGEREPMRVETL